MLNVLKAEYPHSLSKQTIADRSRVSPFFLSTEIEWLVEHRLVDYTVQKSPDGLSSHDLTLFKATHAGTFITHR